MGKGTYFLLCTKHAYSWCQQEDHEIFDLVTELEAAEGKGTTFYSWLEVSSTASTNDIAKAYRKKSMLLQSVFLLYAPHLRATRNTNTLCSPDKNPNVKGVHERFARLGVISTILRNKEGRERYVISSSRFCCSQTLAFFLGMTSSTKMVSQNGEVLGTIIHDSDLVSG